ncbi:MAG: ABC transporter ATP-binding protein, partial [Actinopolymorphaceae bacterium]
LAGIPLWLTGRRNSAEMYTVFFGLTPNDRSRFHIEEIIRGRTSAPEVRAFGLASFLLSRWSTLYDARIEEFRGTARRYIRRSALGSLLGSMVLGLVLVVLLLLLDHGVFDLGAAATACVAVLLLANRCQQAASSLAQVVEQGLYLDDLLSLREWTRSVRPTSRVEVAPFAKLSIDGVSFTYPSATRPALSDVNFEVGAGEVIAIVGQNGSGKTTLAKVLAGLYEPDSGSVQWDDQPLSDLTEDGGLSEAGVVFQDFGRYWFSAAENIGIGDTKRLDDRAGIEAAASRAGMGDFLDKLPAGLDTSLAVEVEGGTDLSVGQWQRVAIARVLFRRASFVILDEPTASLDAEAEAALFETIRGLTAGRTVVLISHRFSTVRTADRILVLHEGKLVESGDHAKLLDLEGLYAKMYRLQSQAYVEA